MSRWVAQHGTNRIRLIDVIATGEMGLNMVLPATALAHELARILVSQGDEPSDINEQVPALLAYLRKL